MSQHNLVNSFCEFNWIILVYDQIILSLFEAKGIIGASAQDNFKYVKFLDTNHNFHFFLEARKFLLLSNPSDRGNTIIK